MTNIFNWVYVDFDASVPSYIDFGSPEFRQVFESKKTHFIEEHNAMGISIALTTCVNDIDAVIGYNSYRWFLSELHKVLRNFLNSDIDQFNWGISELTSISVVLQDQNVILLPDPNFISEFSSFYDYTNPESIQALESISNNGLAFPIDTYVASLYYMYKWLFLFTSGMDQSLEYFGQKQWNERFFRLNTITLYSIEQSLKEKTYWFSWIDDVPEWFVDSRKWTDYDGPLLKVKTYPDWDRYVQK